MTEQTKETQNNQETKMTKRKIILLILIIIMEVLLISSIVYGFIKGENIKNTIKEKCIKLGGKYIDNILGQECYGTDEEGYRFYFKQDIKGNWYKSR